MTRAEGLALTFLLNALWQLPLLFAAAWAGARLLRRAPAAYRHRVWVAALALSLLVPVAGALRPSKLEVSGLVARTPWAAAAVQPPVRTGSADRSSAAPRAGMASWLLRPIAWGWLFATFALALRLGRAWRSSARIVRGARPAPAALDAQAAELGLAGMLRVSEDVAAPMTFGVRRPVIVLPTAFARDAGPEALRGVLVHELAHVRRYDCAINLLCELLALPLALHPAVRALRRRIAGARETACDEAAVAAVGTSCYAATLLDVASAAARPARLAGALGVLDGNCLEDRMKRVLDTRGRLGRRSALLLFAAALGALALAGRGAAAAALQVKGEPGSDVMVGVWKGEWPSGERAGEPAAGLEIVLTPGGPAIDLVLYRYELGSREAPQLERAMVVSQRVEKGVLRFRTRSQAPMKSGEAPATREADWEFSVTDAGVGELRVTLPKLATERAAGKDVPPPPPPLLMKRVPR